jgi:hypothetical protein
MSFQVVICLSLKGYPLIVHLCVCLSIYGSICPSMCLSVHLCFNLPLTFLCLCVAFMLMLLSFEVDKAIADYFKQVFLMSFQVFIYLSFKGYPHIVHPFVCLSIFVSVCSSMCMSATDLAVSLRGFRVDVTVLRSVQSRGRFLQVSICSIFKLSMCLSF